MAGDRGILVANTSAVLTHEGRRVVLRRGVTLVREGHPITQGREHMFEPITLHYDHEAPVEQATAAPGEKRNLQPGVEQPKPRAKPGPKPRRKPAGE